jgi:hypothetical protein
MFSPEFDGLVDNGSKFGIRGVRARFCDLTTHFGGFWFRFSGQVYLGGMRMVMEKCAVSLFYALSTSCYSPPDKHSPAEPKSVTAHP